MVKYTKKTFSKKPRTFRKKIVKKSKTNKVSKLVSLIKKVSLRNCETKYAHKSEENLNINHNSGYVINYLISTTQGITDTGKNTAEISCRLGDEVIGRGISIKLWIANKLDRPNVMYRVIVYKHQANSLPTLTSIFKTGTGNKIMDDIDKELVSVVYQKIFNLQVGYSASATATAGDTDGREAHTYKQIWIPLKNKRIHYNDGGSVPKFFNYAFAIIPYDSYGTLTTDNISSFSYQYKFYFKDP